MIASFKLNKRFRRPVINVVCGGEICPALLDTGANFPVFTLGQRKMDEMGGRSMRHEINFGGFGGGCRGILYRVEVDFGSFRYADLPVICAYNANMPFAFIFSATMFTGFSYTIDDAARTLTVNTNTDDADLRMRINDGLGGFRILTGY